MSNGELVIFGCGGLGLEVFACHKAAVSSGAQGPSFRGFIDNGEPRRAAAQQVWDEDLAFFTQLDELDSAITHFVIAVGDPNRREALYQRCLSHGLTAHSVIHPSAVICDGALIGEGSVLAPFTFVGPAAQVERNSVVNIYGSVGHDARLEYSSVISPYATLNGGASCGYQSFLGTHSAVLPMNRLGNYSKLAAGSVLNTNTDDGALAMGNPARHRVLFRQPQLPENT